MLSARDHTRNYSRAPLTRCLRTFPIPSASGIATSSKLDSAIACVLLYRTPASRPPFITLYRFIAKRRNIFSALTRFGWGRHTERPSHFLIRWAFLRALGIIYLIAFLSLWAQISGLVGSNGIQPAGRLIEVLKQQADAAKVGLDRYHLVPTLCWWNASDGSLRGQCAAGALFAVLLIIGIAPAPCLFLLWLIYLSLATVCSEFLGYQWDYLLLEVGFLAIFLAPLQWLPRVPWGQNIRTLPRSPPHPGPLTLDGGEGDSRAALAQPADRRPQQHAGEDAGAPRPAGSIGPRPSRIVLWLLRWLLFRLMFESGCVKLLSGDPTWRNLTALTFHYETQPLPTWIGWYAHQLPVWAQKTSTLAMFCIELILPFFIFLPRRPRFWACCAFVALQVVIILTGNYCFFNLLTLALCLMLLDDAALLRVIPAKWRSLATLDSRPSTRRLLRWPIQMIMPLACIVVVVSLMQLGGTLRLRIPWPSPLYSIYQWAYPLKSVNGYGLFAVMTRPRVEIVVQGSNDGRTWLDYEFKYKPGDVARWPGFVEPHQPRLDWQMWFAALSNVQQQPWFLGFCIRLLHGSPEVLALLEHNPFPKTPPHYIRAMRYEYHFTGMAERRKTGDWWRREYRGLYMPPLALEATNSGAAVVQ